MVSKACLILKLKQFFDREFLAEFLSTLILVLLGDGSVAQYKLLNTGKAVESEPFLSINFGYGCAVMFGAYIAGGISGAHMNPAVSISLAVGRKFSWCKVPKYITAQMLGGFVGALLVFITYIDRLMDEGKLNYNDSYRGIFATYPASGTTTAGQFLDQIVGTLLLLLIVCSLGDTKNSAPPAGLGPVLVGAGVFSIGVSFGTNCGYAINPARDLAPRFATLILGYDDTFGAADYYFWVPVIGPIVGAILGVGCYVFMIEKHHESEKQKLEKEEGRSSAEKGEVALSSIVIENGAEGAAEEGAAENIYKAEEVGDSGAESAAMIKDK